MSAKKFWRLSWYEYGLATLRILNLRKVENDRNELNIRLTRRFMSLYYSSVRSKKDPEHEEEDFWRLPSEINKDEPEIDKEERERRLFAFANKAKKRLKKKNG